MNPATFFGLTLSCTAILLSACSAQQQSTPTTNADTRPAAMAAIGQTAERYGKAISTRNVEAILANYTADTWLFPPNAPIAKSADERRAYWAAQQFEPGVSDTVGVTARIEVAQSGELAVEYGSFFQLKTDKDGASTSTPQKYVAAWAKQADGSWKVIADMWNTDEATRTAPANQRGPARK